MKKDMVKFRLLVLAFATILLPFRHIAYAGEEQFVSNPLNATGQYYLNPIIEADYSDPDVCASADGKTFYMTASSFQCTPGLPILKSTDLVNWTLVNYALEAVPPTDYYTGTPRHGKGVWAPSIRCHDGVYYIFWGDPDFGIFMIKTTDPEGRWSEPVLVRSGRGMIDPTPLWDTDGRAYLANAWAASRVGFNSVITVWEMKPDGSALIGTPRVVFDGNDGVNHTVEGPKLYRRGDYYYILAPAGGVVDGWQLALRSKNIYGPYEKQIVMARGDTDINGPHQGGLVSTPAGGDWFVHFQDRGLYGRVIHLNPVHWNKDWPVMGFDADGDLCGRPFGRHEKPAGLQPSSGTTAVENLFQWHANYEPTFGFPTPESMMRIYGHRVSESFVNMWEVPNLWLQKLPCEEFTATAHVCISAKGAAEDVSSGMIIMGWDYARLGLAKKSDKFVLQLAKCTDAEKGGAEDVTDIATISPTRVYDAGLLPNMECDLWLRAVVKKEGVCTFAYSTDGRRYQAIPGAWQARAGKWIGAKIGFYSITPADVSDRGWIDIIDFQVDRK